MKQDTLDRLGVFITLLSIGIGAYLVYLRFAKEEDINNFYFVLVFIVGFGIPHFIGANIEAEDVCPDDIDVDL